MAKSRKKKNVTQQFSIAKDYEVTKTYFDKFSEVARKTLLLLDLDPTLFDHFSKKQKMEMMHAKVITPRVIVKKGHSVPRQYVRLVQQEMHRFMKMHYVGSSDIGLFFIDFVTYGMTFLMFIQARGNLKEYCEQSDTYKLIAAKAQQADDDSTNNLMNDYWYYLHYQLQGLSKINFRIYGFEWEWKETENRCKFAGHVMLTSNKPQKIHFTYNNKVRPAFKVGIGQYISSESIYFAIPYNKIIEESEQTYLLEVYVQSHALNRLKERLNVLAPVKRNVLLNSSLQNSSICRFNNGQLVLKYTDANNNILGYLPFTIINKKLFILSFLPICSQNAPEGKRLQELLGITRKEMEFLGMDKLSFFIDTDFEAIPRLKQAIIDADLWHLIKLEPFYDYESQNYLSAATLSRFFQTECTHEDVLSEIGERY